MNGADTETGCYFGREEPGPRDPGGRLPVALVFPGPSRLAVSSLGWQAVYRLMMAEDSLAVERVFLESPHDEVRSRESGRKLSSFPLVAFSLTFEEDYAALAAMLKNSGIEPMASGRNGSPLVLAGGPPSFLNPAPMARFVDMFFVGEAEAGFVSMALKLSEHLYSGGKAEDFPALAAGWPGVYVPGKSDIPVKRVLAPGQGNTLAAPAYSCFISHQAQFKDTLLLEVNRGCPFGCRFCAAGYIYRPPRQARVEDLMDIVERTSPPKVGLVGTALTEWPPLMEFLTWLHKRSIKFTLASVRADGLTDELMSFLRRVGIRTITLALEGPSQRLRQAASKKLDPGDFLDAVEICARYGVNHLKMYLIVGWPGETDEDYLELKDFLHEIDAARARGMGNRKRQYMRMSLSMSCLTPKPFTPLQWAPMASEKDLARSMKMVRDMGKKIKGLAVNPAGAWQARLQGLLARGDESLADLVLMAADLGWKKALKKWDRDPDEVLARQWSMDDPLPWDVVDIGVSKKYLWNQWQKYLEASPSPSCPARDCDSCRACGMDDFLS